MRRDSKETSEMMTTKAMRQTDKPGGNRALHVRLFMKKILFALALASAGLSAGVASAQTVTEQQLTQNGSMGISDGFETRGQALIVPAGATRLQQFTLGLNGSITPVVRAYDNATSTLGPVLYTGAPLTNSPFGDVTTVIPAGGIAVTPGSYIFIGATQNAPGLAGGASFRNTNVYASGFVVDSRNGTTAKIPAFDAYFTAVFERAQVVAIPTMTEWAMILFGTILAGGAAVYIQRRRQFV